MQRRRLDIREDVYAKFEETVEKEVEAATSPEALLGLVNRFKKLAGKNYKRRTFEYCWPKAVEQAWLKYCAVTTNQEELVEMCRSISQDYECRQDDLHLLALKKLMPFYRSDVPR